LRRSKAQFYGPRAASQNLPFETRRKIRASPIIELNIPSYRVEHAKQKQQAENQADDEGGEPA
jgi:hypothetical protein